MLKNSIKYSLYIIMVMFVYFVSQNKHLNIRFSPFSNLVIHSMDQSPSLSRIKYENDKSLFKNNKKTINILVVGDSHAIDGLNSLKSYEKDGKFEIKYLFLDDDCLKIFNDFNSKGFFLNKKETLFNENCSKNIKAFKKSELFVESEVIIYSSEWKKTNLKYLKSFFFFIKNSNKKGVLLGPNALFLYDIGDILLRSNSRVHANSLAYKFLDGDIFKLEKEMKNTAEDNNVIFFSRLDTICKMQQCEIVFQDNQLGFLDRTHWTLIGAERYGKKMYGPNLNKIFDLK